MLFCGCGRLTIRCCITFNTHFALAVVFVIFLFTVLAYAVLRTLYMCANIFADDGPCVAWTLRGLESLLQIVLDN